MHNTIDSSILKRRLYEEGYDDNSISDNLICRLQNLDDEDTELLINWVENNRLIQFEPIGGVSSQFLREKLNMKEPAILIAHAMLKESPEENSSYFNELANNALGFYPFNLGNS